MKIDRIWVDASTFANNEEMTYGVGDECQVDGKMCKIVKITPARSTYGMAERGCYHIQLEAPSGTRASAILVNSRHVVNVELVGD